MFVVSFIENKNVLLSQLRRSVPAIGEDLRIKGRKAKVASVNPVDEKIVHVQVVLEALPKAKAAVADQSKKKKR